MGLTGRPHADGPDGIRPVYPEAACLQEQERAWIRRALALAKRGLGLTSPNPAVGAVLVRDGVVVGEGFHERAGSPHAEVVALCRAGERARGATLYVTLEPCCHWGRTPPCADALIAADVARVVACAIDPNPKVNGRGFARLAAAGIPVALAEPWAQDQARSLNVAYEKYITSGLPYVTLKAAVTLDGKIATASGESRWITGEPARQEAHRLRAQHDAVVVGVGTVLTDDPMLDVRLSRSGARRQPLRVVVDSLARTPESAALLQPRRPAGPVLVATTPAAPAHRVEVLKAMGAEVVCLPATREGRVDLRALLETLAGREVTGVLVEGGGTLHASFLEAGLADRVVVFVAPRILGGREAPTFVEGAGRDRLEAAWPVFGWRVRRLPGGDLVIDGHLRPQPRPAAVPDRRPAVRVANL